MSEIAVRGRVRLIDEPEAVGTVLKLNDKSAIVLFDGYETSNRVLLDKLEPKRGRTHGTIGPEPEPSKPLELECVMADVVRRRMSELNLSWSTLCDKTGVSRSTLGRLFRDGPDRMYLETIEALAAGLGIDPGEFWRRIA